MHVRNVENVAFLSSPFFLRINKYHHLVLSILCHQQLKFSRMNFTAGLVEAFNLNNDPLIYHGPSNLEVVRGPFWELSSCFRLVHVYLFT